MDFALSGLNKRAAQEYHNWKAGRAGPAPAAPALPTTAGATGGHEGRGAARPVEDRQGGGGGSPPDARAGGAVPAQGGRGLGAAEGRAGDRHRARCQHGPRRAAGTHGQVREPPGDAGPQRRIGLRRRGRRLRRLDRRARHRGAVHRAGRAATPHPGPGVPRRQVAGVVRADERQAERPHRSRVVQEPAGGEGCPGARVPPHRRRPQPGRRVRADLRAVGSAEDPRGPLRSHAGRRQQAAGGCRCTAIDAELPPPAAAGAISAPWSSRSGS